MKNRSKTNSEDTKTNSWQEYDEERIRAKLGGEGKIVLDEEDPAINMLTAEERVANRKRGLAAEQSEFLDALEQRFDERLNLVEHRLETINDNLASITTKLRQIGYVLLFVLFLVLLVKFIF